MTRYYTSQYPTRDALEADIESVAMPLLETAVSCEYSKVIWERIRTEVIENVLESSGVLDGDYFDSTDIRYAIGRILKNLLGEEIS